MTKPRPQKGSPAVRTFSAPLERMRSRLNWIIIFVPFDVKAVWGTRGQLRVRGEINGFAFRSALFPTRQGQHLLLVNKRMQKGARAVVGTVARFCMEPDMDPRDITVPPELNRIFTQNRALRRWVEQMSPSVRAEIAKWVREPKNPETRARRADQMAERLLAAMEAEMELPPALRLVFARNPVAHDGWEHMSPAKRRGHLLGIFGYRSPESQARRIQKMLDEATELAGKIRDKDT